MTIEVKVSDEFAATLADALSKLLKSINVSCANDDVVEKVVTPVNVCEVESDAPPTEEDVRKYIEEKGYLGFNVVRFVEYYNDKDWKTKSGKDMLRDDGWKKTLDSWMINGLNSGSSVNVTRNTATGTTTARSAFAPTEGL